MAQDEVAASTRQPRTEVIRILRESRRDGAGRGCPPALASHGNVSSYNMRWAPVHGGLQAPAAVH